MLAMQEIMLLHGSIFLEALFSEKAEAQRFVILYSDRVLKALLTFASSMVINEYTAMGEKQLYLEGETPPRRTLVSILSEASATKLKCEQRHLWREMETILRRSNSQLSTIQRKDVTHFVEGKCLLDLGPLD